MKSKKPDLLKPALLVGDLPENFDPSKVPADGHSYLQQVRWEASKCEDIVSVDIDEKRFERAVVSVLPDCQTIPPQFLPDTNWQMQAMADFERVRRQVVRYQESCFPVMNPLPKAEEDEAWYDICVEGSRTPLISAVSELPDSLVGHLLECNVEWLQERKKLSPSQGRWLYALLACVHQPLYPDTCSTIRTLARECAKVRAQLVLGSSEPDVAPYNLIICLVAHYFRQMDLADVVK